MASPLRNTSAPGMFNACGERRKRCHLFNNDRLAILSPRNGELASTSDSVTTKAGHQYNNATPSRNIINSGFRNRSKAKRLMEDCGEEDYHHHIVISRHFLHDQNDRAIIRNHSAFIRVNSPENNGIPTEDTEFFFTSSLIRYHLFLHITASDPEGSSDIATILTPSHGDDASAENEDKLFPARDAIEAPDEGFSSADQRRQRPVLLKIMVISSTLRSSPVHRLTR